MNAVRAPQLAHPSLDESKYRLLQDLLDGLAPDQLYWIAAYAASLAARGQTAAVPTAAAQAGFVPLTVLYGSQTGNAQRLAERLAKRLRERGVVHRLLRASDYPQRELAKERQLLVVISTQGDAEPPDDARGLVEFIHGKRAPRLEQLRFSVLGLGDSSYPEFCAIGRGLDQRLAELGAERMLPAAEADLDIDSVAGPWLDGVSSLVEAAQAEQPQPQALASARPAIVRAVPDSPQYSREHPFTATVLANQRIVARGSEREVRHIELSLAGSGLSYQPGDALGVWPRNPPQLVEQILNVLDLDGGETVALGGRELLLRDWLTSERELTRLHRPLLQLQAERGGHAKLTEWLATPRSPELVALLASHQLVDVFQRYPAQWPAQDLVAALRPLAPRSYSIASSASRVGEDEVHLTVATVDYVFEGHARRGAASVHLAALEEDAGVAVFIEPNQRFRLPAESSRDVIMIGPGTGVAPFRAFVQERAEQGAQGRNWLFFGNRHFSRDFLYQVEWQAALRRGELSRLDLAFSRDQQDKRYVQHVLREQGREVYAWLRDGAHLYVCGDASQMARDVHATLIEVIAEHGGRSHEQAQQWLGDLLQEGRYARDVY